MLVSADRVFELKASSLPRLLLPILLLSFLYLTPLGMITTAAASPEAVSSISINVQVDHRIEVQRGGSVVIKDTLGLSTNPGEMVESLQNFSIGFPFRYSSNLDYCFAYETANPKAQLRLASNVGLGRIGFYGATVIFDPPVDISNGGSYNFTVVFVFSNLISANSESTFNLDFPMYPTLTEKSSVCNVTLVLPIEASYEASSYNFSSTTLGPYRILNYTKAPLEAFVKDFAWLRFTHTDFPLIDNEEVRREIILDEVGQIHISDSYLIVNRGIKKLSEISLGLSRGAYQVSAWDTFGSLSVSVEEQNVTTYTNVTVTLRESLNMGNRGEFTVKYLLPRENHVVQEDWGGFNLSFTMLERFHWIVRKLTVSLILPEGAEFVHVRGANPTVVQRETFQDEVVFTIFNATSLHTLQFSVAYTYPIFWASFRPTLLVGLVVAAIGAAVLLRRPLKPPVPIIPIPTDVLRRFVDAYEEKDRLLRELEMMERQARKGKVPRHRYKVRRRTLESRLSTLSRDLADLREKMRSAGARYAEMMGRIEAAETELEGVEADTRRIETRYRRRELSSEAYRRLLEEYHRRRERAKTIIEGLLLRLREEIR